MKAVFRGAAWVLWLGLAVVGLWGVYLRLTTGHRLSNYGSYVPWGLWVATYVYFSGMSAGIFLLSMFVVVFRIRRFERLVRMGLFLAAITLVMALLSISFDLGHMFRAHEVLLRPNFHSVMAWMVWLYTVYFLFLLGLIWLELRCDLSDNIRLGGALVPLYRVLSLGWRCPKDGPGREVALMQTGQWRRRLAYVAIPLAILFSSGLGALFATISAKPYWHQSLFPVLFLAGGLLSGGALMLWVMSTGQSGNSEEETQIRRIMARTVLLLLLIDIIIELAEVLVPVWYGVGPEYTLYRRILLGRFAFPFWGIHVLLGVAVPFVLLTVKPACRWATATAGILITITFLAVRLLLVVPGEVTPVLRGLQEAYSDSRLTFAYTPSLFEWAVVAFILALGWTVFFVGVRVLPVHKAGMEPDKA